MDQELSKNVRCKDVSQGIPVGDENIEEDEEFVDRQSDIDYDKFKELRITPTDNDKGNRKRLQCG